MGRAVTGLLWISLVLIFHQAKGFQIITKSQPNILALQGGELRVFCETDIKYTYCKWSVPYLEKQVTCELTSSGLGVEKQCLSDPKLRWDSTSTKCGLVMDEVTREYQGNFTCLLFSDITGAQSVNASTLVDVAAPAKVKFEGEFEFDGDVHLKANQQVEIECRAERGFPKPELRASLGSEVGPISNDPRLDRLLDESSNSDEYPNGDETITVKKVFTYLPQSHDCGKFIKCQANQSDEQYSGLFTSRGPTVIYRKINVEFPPEPFFKELPPFRYGPNSDEMLITLEFIANPTPINSRAIWHINPTHQVDMNSIVVQAGEVKGKYEAFGLKINSHSVNAVLKIKHPNQVEDGYEYFLNVSTSEGSQRYNFKIELHSTGYTELEPSQNDDQAWGKDGENQPKSNGMGVGIIVAIVLIVFFVLVVIGAIVWMKNNNKLCFAGNQPRTQQERDAAAAAEAGNSAEAEKLNQPSF